MRRISIPHSAARQRGVNLVEILAVLLIVSLLAGVAWPAGQGMINQAELRSATNTAFNALLYTRHEAARLRQTAYLCFIPSTSQPTCQSQSTGTLGVFVEKSGEADQLVQAFDLSAQARLHFVGIEHPHKISFGKLGQRERLAEQNGTAYLNVELASAQRHVEVCYNGRIRIREQLTQSECQG
ncbi:pilus assembly FimT family protein [Marinospirillum sp.]|uniref:pilus assembly FimT family protein n=1 Tax=Marinospirillum sp. TaxID=2183934 RepID=UPI003A8B49F9